MRSINQLITLLTVTGFTVLSSPLATADETVTCKSFDGQYTHCNTSRPGYVTLKKQLSGTRCVQGRTWDFDRRGVWVDDGCKGKFRVETFGNSNKNKNNSNDDEVAAGLILGALLLGALASDDDSGDDHRFEDEYKYKDKNYYGSRHTSYVPGWMIGKFEGYNTDYGASVSLKINSDGKVKVKANGQKATGWINDERLHIGGAVFDIEKTRRGFITSQKGDPHNEVQYRRVN